MNEKELEELIEARKPSTPEELKDKAEAYIMSLAKEAAEGPGKRLPKKNKRK